jgi:hypothetical protein
MQRCRFVLVIICFINIAILRDNFGHSPGKVRSQQAIEDQP